MSISRFFLACALFAPSCVLPDVALPDVKLPDAATSSDLRIEVSGVLFRNQRTMVAVTGVATNESTEDMGFVYVTFPLYWQGLKVGDAIASSQSLEAGRSWVFEAAYIRSAVRQQPLDEVGVPKIQVTTF